MPCPVATRPSKDLAACRPLTTSRPPLHRTIFRPWHSQTPWSVILQFGSRIDPRGMFCRTLRENRKAPPTNKLLATDMTLAHPCPQPSKPPALPHQKSPHSPNHHRSPRRSQPIRRVGTSSQVLKGRKPIPFIMPRNLPPSRKANLRSNRPHTMSSWTNIASYVLDPQWNTKSKQNCCANVYVLPAVWIWQTLGSSTSRCW